MGSRILVVALWSVASLVFLPATASAAAAKQRPITGKLSAGYTLIAVGPHGNATSVLARGKAFRLRPPARTVTLHLRAPNGLYAGPVLVRRQGRRAVLGVKAGARLGALRVRAGYARLARRLSRRWIDSRYDARARRGVPIGARRFGRVRSRPPRTPPPVDRDRDGIPNPLDIDDDGDLVLDPLDRSRRARASQARQEFPFELTLSAAIHETANVNAAGLTVGQMDALLVARTSLHVRALGDSAELDCGTDDPATPAREGLIYCSGGNPPSTGRLVQPSGRDLGSFPSCCDSDRDGFGSLGGILAPRATTAQIGTGDVLIQRLEGSAPAATLTYVFASVPALVSYSDTAGNCAKVSGTRGSCATEFSYPVTGPDPCGGPCPGPPPPPGPGTRENPFPVTAGPGDDIVVTLTFWRPQRRAIPPQAGDWYDIGRLIYEVEAGDAGRDCPQDAYTTTEENLTPAPLPAPPGEDETGGLRDGTPDALANADNTFTFTVNLSACLRARRVDVPDESWNPGEMKGINLRGTDRLGYASQGIFFKRQ